MKCYISVVLVYFTAIACGLAQQTLREINESDFAKPTGNEQSTNLLNLNVISVSYESNSDGDFRTTIVDEPAAGPILLKERFVVKESYRDSMILKTEEAYSANEVLFKLKDGVDISSIETVNFPFSGEIIPLKSRATYIYRISDYDQNSVRELISYMSAFPELFEFAEINGLFTIAGPGYTPSGGGSNPSDDPGLDDQWHLNNDGTNGTLSDADIDANEGWAIRTSARRPNNSKIIVAVLDTGVDTDHPDLVGNLWNGNGLHGLSEVPSSSSPEDVHGHGTAVCGVIGAVGDNDTGISGVAWDIEVLSIRIYSSSGSSLHAWVADAISEAVSRGAKVINFSSNSISTSNAIEDAISDANTAKVLFVCSAGNEGLAVNTASFKYLPYLSNTTNPNLVKVASTTSSDYKSLGSNYGTTYVQLAAPGGTFNGSSVWDYECCSAGTCTCDNKISNLTGSEGIYTTTWGGGYGLKVGTSYAAPMVAAVLALTFAQFPDDWNNHTDVKDRVLNSIDRKLIGTTPKLNTYVSTAGRLNLHRSLSVFSKYALKPPPGSSQSDYYIRDTKGLFHMNTSTDGEVMDMYYPDVEVDTFGWIFVHENSSATDGNIWFWDYYLEEWFWTSTSYYPTFFRDSDSTYYTYMVGSSNGSRWWYNLTTSQWIQDNSM